MSKKFRVTDPAAKEEIRRLTQLANRRIKTAEKQYSKEGKTVLPKDVVGKFSQDKSEWHTPKQPLSRKIFFESEKAYKQHLKYLQSFDPKAPGQTKPTMTEYTKIQRVKTAEAMFTSLGTGVPLTVLERINQLNAAQLSEFWRVYKEKSVKLLKNYSSLQAMQDTLNELYPEDIAQVEKAVTVDKPDG